MNDLSKILASKKVETFRNNIETNYVIKKDSEQSKDIVYDFDSSKLDTTSVLFFTLFGGLMISMLYRILPKQK